MEILVYVDPSSRGEWALKAAEPLLPALATDVALLATAEDVQADPQLLERAEARLKGKASRVRKVVGKGPAERAVFEETSAHRFLMVVVPPAGRRAIARLIKGSRVATVVRQVSSSVLVARRPPDRFRRVLVAVAGGPHSLSTTLSAVEVARALHADVTVLHVQSAVDISGGLPHPGRFVPGGDEREAERRETFGEISQILARHGYRRDLTIREGFVLEELLAEIEENAHDLLVIGAHRAEGRDRWMLDDVTERILLGCPIPILVVRAPEPAVAG